MQYAELATSIKSCHNTLKVALFGMTNPALISDQGLLNSKYNTLLVSSHAYQERMRGFLLADSLPLFYVGDDKELSMAEAGEPLGFYYKNKAYVLYADGAVDSKAVSMLEHITQSVLIRYPAHIDPWQELSLYHARFMGHDVFNADIMAILMKFAKDHPTFTGAITDAQLAHLLQQLDLWHSQAMTAQGIDEAMINYCLDAGVIDKIAL